jgi:hypothetical protein
MQTCSLLRLLQVPFFANLPTLEADTVVLVPQCSTAVAQQLLCPTSLYLNSRYIKASDNQQPTTRLLSNHEHNNFGHDNPRLLNSKNIGSALHIPLSTRQVFDLLHTSRKAIQQPHNSQWLACLSFAIHHQAQSLCT